MTMTLEGFATDSAFQTRLKNDTEAIAAIFKLIPKEFHGSVKFISAEYNHDYAMGFRLMIDGNRFVAVNSQQYPHHYNFKLYHDGLRFTQPIYKPEYFSRQTAEEYNTRVQESYYAVFWKVAGVILLIGTCLGFVLGSGIAGLMVGWCLVPAGYILTAIDLTRNNEDGDFRHGINAPLRDSTLEVLGDSRAS
jgi:hypothetical protein